MLPTLKKGKLRLNCHTARNGTNQSFVVTPSRTFRGNILELPYTFVEKGRVVLCYVWFSEFCSYIFNLLLSWAVNFRNISKGNHTLVFHSVVGSHDVWVITVCGQSCEILPILLCFPPTHTHTKAFANMHEQMTLPGAFLSRGFPGMWPRGCGLCVWLCVGRDASHPPGGCAHCHSHPRSAGEPVSCGPANPESGPCSHFLPV